MWFLEILERLWKRTRRTAHVLISWTNSMEQTSTRHSCIDLVEHLQTETEDTFIYLNGSNPPQMNAKCDVVMKLSVFGTRTDTHTPIHPRYAGCNNVLWLSACCAVGVEGGRWSESCGRCHPAESSSHLCLAHSSFTKRSSRLACVVCWYHGAWDGAGGCNVGCLWQQVSRLVTILLCAQFTMATAQHYRSVKSHHVGRWELNRRQSAGILNSQSKQFWNTRLVVVGGSGGLELSQIEFTPQTIQQLCWFQ